MKAFMANNCSLVDTIGYYTLTAVSPSHKFSSQEEQSTTTINAIARSSECNSISVSSSLLAIASAEEAYQLPYSGICAGIVSKLYVPLGDAFNSSISPLQPAYFVQSLIEAKLQSFFDEVPDWVSETCHYSMRKLFCSVNMPSTESKRIGDVLMEKTGLSSASLIDSLLAKFNFTSSQAWELLNHEFYVPSYPTSTACSDYQSQCKLVAKVSGRSAFTVSCSGVINSSTSMGVSPFMFPKAAQTVLRLQLTTEAKEAFQLSSQQFISITSLPNKLSAAVNNVSGFYTRCPYGYVKPDHPSDRRNRWVEGTGCAVACRYVLWF
jgi:hypothetical protein